MSRKFKIDKNPVDNFQMYMKDQIELDYGLTVLVGCNGAGKTTLLQLIKNQLDEAEIPYMTWDNYVQGGVEARRVAAVEDDVSMLAHLTLSSEGEQIYLNMGRIASKIGKFIMNNWHKKEIWLIFDAIDSGLSVDNIDEIKKLFKLILKDNIERDMHILVVANSYELCRNSRCFDVINGEYVTFKDYEEYRDFVFKSREIKDKRFAEEGKDEG